MFKSEVNHCAMSAYVNHLFKKGISTEKNVLTRLACGQICEVFFYEIVEFPVEGATPGLVVLGTIRKQQSRLPGGGGPHL